MKPQLLTLLDHLNRVWIRVLMRYINIIILSFLSLFTNFDKQPENIKIAHDIIKKISKTLKQQYDLNLIGIRESTNNGVYQSIGILFAINRVLIKNEGRKILIATLDEILFIINSHEEFKKYMSEYPFTLKNINVAIFPNSNGKCDVYYPNICDFSSFNNKLQYSTRIRGGGYYYTEEEETYEEAKKIIESKNE